MQHLYMQYTSIGVYVNRQKVVYDMQVGSGVRIYLLLNRWTNQKMLLQGPFTLVLGLSMSTFFYPKATKKLRKRAKLRFSLRSGIEGPEDSVKYFISYK